MEPKRSKVKRVLIWSIVGLIVLAVVFMAFVNRASLYSEIKIFEDATSNFVQSFRSDSLTPPPLRAIFGETGKPLTQEGVLEWTNKNREENNAKVLALNNVLSEMASHKLNDMFAKQYFEHESPTGIGSSGLANQAGYDYIVIGENLAMGNFDGDKALVDAWMASPGHRANIINTRYQEIGIAVGQGTFEGKTVWMAVQEFGMPVSACPQPSKLDKNAIDIGKKNVDALDASLTEQKKVIDDMDIKYGDSYEARIEKYNSTVQKYNVAVTALKSKISAYNKQAQAFNACVQTPTSTTGH